ncbi:MAG TPA: hypothetical protein VHI71_03045 [Actinomycetota bacterium]|nr:hypothetical protein [Actinomycetota bacterium]
MKKCLIALALCAVVGASALPAHAAKGGLKTLGTDPSGDGWPGLDVTYLQVGRKGADLEVRIGLAMLPQLGGYPDLPGIEWVFTVQPPMPPCPPGKYCIQAMPLRRTFVAEAVKTVNGSAFYLFEVKPDGSFEQIGQPQGTYAAADGYTSILVPLKAIGARKGAEIKGADGLEHGDVDAHVHVGPQTHYPDGMETNKSYVLP